MDFVCFNGFCQREFREQPAQMQNEIGGGGRLEERPNCEKEKSDRETNMDLMFFKLQWCWMLFHLADKSHSQNEEINKLRWVKIAKIHMIEYVLFYHIFIVINRVFHSFWEEQFYEA